MEKWILATESRWSGPTVPALHSTLFTIFFIRCSTNCFFPDPGLYWNHKEARSPNTGAGPNVKGSDCYEIQG